MTKPRTLSPTGFYHVVLKGNNSMALFECDRDYQFFIELLTEIKDQFDIAIHAWCLMINHVHLLAEDQSNQLSPAIYRVEMNYARKFNYFTGREGTVFRRNYWREPIDDECYLLTAMNYIHYNPQAAGICVADAYRWSSYRAYAEDQLNDTLTTTRLLLDLVGGVEGFLKFSEHYQPTVNPFPGSSLRNHLSIEELKIAASKVVDLEELLLVKKMAPKDRVPLLRALAYQGFKPVQIRFLTDLSFSQISDALEIDTW